jgi:DNA-binding Lrp family transcriptional regulator
MKLSSKEILVLHAVLLQARHSVEKIAQQVGIQSHTVRRLITKLQEHKVLLGMRAYVNACALGLNEYQVFFSLPRTSLELQNKLLEHLTNLQGVSLLSELNGDPQFELHYMARNTSEALILLDSIRAITPEAHISSFSLTHEQYYSGVLGYLLRKSPDYSPLRFGPIDKTVPTDALDHSLLCRLANFTVSSQRELARKLGVPESTVAARISSLETRGIIHGYYHLCDFKPLGLLPVVGLLYTSVLNQKLRRAIVDFCNAHPGIAYVDLTIGPYSTRIFMRAQSYDDARLIMQEIRNKFTDIIVAIRIMPQLKFMKHSTYPWVE